MTSSELNEPARVEMQLADATATESLAVKLVAALPEDSRGCMLLLQGELGAGKSTLARAMLHEMGHVGPAPSPTYTLVEPYELPGSVVYHIDLYRISGMEELEYLGWSDLRDGLILLEWPERVPQLAKDADLNVFLEYSGDARKASLQSLSSRGKAMLKQLDANS